MIRLGLIGAGLAFEKLHWPVLQKMPGQFRVTAVASRTRQKAEAVAQQVKGARVYDRYQDLLADPAVDAVLIAVPIEVNHSVLIDAMRSGKHVLAEKPLAATPEQGLAVLATPAPNSVIAIAENFRYRKELAKAREVLAQGLIGGVFAFQVSVRFHLDAEVRRGWTERPWRRDPQYPGGFLLDAGVHPVSFLRDLLGEVSEVFAYTLDRHPLIGGPDSLLMQMKLASGAIGHYFACYTAKVEQESPLDFAAYGEHGTLAVTPGRVSWTQGIEKRGGVFRCSKSDRGYKGQWQNFANAIHGREALVSTPAEAFRDLLVIDAGLRSAQSGRPAVPEAP